MKQKRKPSRKRAAVRKPQAKSSTQKIKSALYLLILVIAVTFIAVHFISEVNFRNKMNDTTEQLNSALETQDKDRMMQLMNELEVLHKDHQENYEHDSVIKSNLMQCYRFFAGDYGASLQKQIEYLEKINAINPGALSEKEKELMKLKGLSR